MVLDVNTLDAGTGYLDLGLSIVSPVRGSDGLRRRHQRRRGVRAAVPRPAHRPGPPRRDRGGRLHRRVDGRLIGLPLHRPRRGLAARAGAGAPARHRPGRRHRRARRARPPVRASVSASAAASRRSCCSARTATPPRPGTSTPPDADLVPRSLGGRRPGVEYRAEHVRDGGFLLVTDDDAVEYRLVACPLPGPNGQDHSDLARGQAGGPGRASRTGRRVRRARRDVTAAGRRPGHALVAQHHGRRPGRPGRRGHQPIRRR